MLRIRTASVRSSSAMARWRSARAAEPFRSLLQAVQAEVTEVGFPRNWLGWLAKAAVPAFTNALDVARRGKDEWSIDDQTADPMQSGRSSPRLKPRKMTTSPPNGPAKLCPSL